MLRRIFPERIDNTFRGHKAGLWLFVPIVLWKVAISLGSIFNGHEAAQSADKIPLDTFTSGGADAVVSLFALLGLSQLLIGVICAVAWIRYRAMIPFLYALFLVEFVAKRAILLVKPIASTGTSPATPIGLAILALTIAGLVLSLSGKSEESS